MTNNWPDPPTANFPEVADDDYPERQDYPEPREPMLPADDGYVGADEFGTTPEEEREGEPLSARLDREEPDPTQDPAHAHMPEEARDPDYDDQPAGRLVEPDAGMRPDNEADLVASATADPLDDPTAEEAAVRIHPNP